MHCVTTVSNVMLAFFHLRFLETGLNLTLVLLL